MTDPITITAVLGLIADKVIDAFLLASSEKVVEGTWEKLKSDEAKNAFKLALVVAIKQYAETGKYAKTGLRSAFVGPLLDKNGLLTEEPVIEELVQILRFEREPNCQFIGDRWKARIQNPPQERNFTVEAQVFVNCLKDGLKNSGVFGPVFNLKLLDAINQDVSSSGQVLVNIEAELVGLSDMMNARLSELVGVLARSNPIVQDQIIDFTRYIQERTDSFVGRDFIFQKIDQFVRNNPRGFFLITGDPGIGKTAMMAEWVKARGSIHHFNIRAEGIDKTETFLRNVHGQIVATYRLDPLFLPPGVREDQKFENSLFLKGLLDEVSKKLRQEERAVIIIDALDEVEDSGMGNLLYLPKELPQGIFIVATARKIDFRLSIDCEQETLFIEQDSADNKKDIRRFVERWTEREGIQRYINSQEIDRELFIDYMTEEKSQGNFMYLRHVLPAIDKGEYKDLTFAKLPIGLANYYQGHWHRIRTQSENDWFDYKLPILVALSIVKAPVSIERIADFSKVQDRRRINSVLYEWQQFLYEQKIEYKGGLQKRYRLYHDSFREFIASKDEVEGEHVDLKKAHGIIADKMLEEIYGND